MHSFAFCAPLCVGVRAGGPCGVMTQRSRLPVRAARVSRRTARMADDVPPPAEEEEEVTVPLTSASGILKSMREQVAAEPYVPPGDSVPRGGLGVTRDQDGKSNVWAVEPKMDVDEKPQLSKAAILAAVFGCVIAALLILPNLPFTNGDQF